MADQPEMLAARAVRAACDVAASRGLRCDDAVILRNGSNILVHLRPRPIVARIPATIAIVRAGDAWLARELAIASHLAAAGAPVVAPSDELPPGPHYRDELALSFWRFVLEQNENADVRSAGVALRQCHETLADFAEDLPPMAALIETEKVLSELAELDIASDDATTIRRIARRTRAEIESLHLPIQALHGDAHLGNVLNSTDGPLWNDWEDTFAGPIAWDLACLVAASRVLGGDESRAQAALSGYGAGIDADVLDVFVEARAAQIAAWCALAARRQPEKRDRLRKIVSWLRLHAA
jgi:hypothetical protein